VSAQQYGGLTLQSRNGGEPSDLSNLNLLNVENSGKSAAADLGSRA
jgi:hypothetical protein